MAKTAEELNAIKEEIETLNEKLVELSEEDLKQVTGGIKVNVEDDSSLWRMIADFFFKIK